MTSKRVLPNSIPELTGLRGIAIIMVVIYHGAWPRAVGASLGVDIFFVLSGFLITSLLFREAQSAGSISLKNFYMRRVLRLLPALILMLVGITLYSLFFMSAEMFRHTFLDAIAAIFYSTNWIRAFSLNDSILGHTWSLSIEEQFYILWPAIFIFVTRRRSSRLRFVLIAILVLAPLFLRALMQHNGVSPFRIYNGLDTRADDLMVGCFLSFLFFGDRSEPGQTATWCRLLKPAATAAFIVLVFMCAFADQLNPSYNYFGYTLVQVCCGLILASVMQQGDSLLKKFLRSRPLLWFGKISYSLYLWHYPICIILEMRGYKQYQTSLISLGCALLLSVMSYYLVEVRFLNFKRRFESDKRRPITSEGQRFVYASH